MDYDQLYKTLARAIIKAEGRIGDDTAAFVAEFAARLPQSGVALDGEAQAALDAYLGDMEAAVKAGVAEAVAVGLGLPASAAALSSETVLAAAEQAFAARWPDGLTLSRRLWDWREDTRLGIERELKNGVRQGQAVGKTLYAMQRAVERAPGGRRFEIVQNHTDDWVDGLRRSAAAAIHNLEGRAAWQGALDTVRRHIDTLKATGTRPAAERALGQIQAAVDTGRADLLDHAVKWWVYDRQLYHLKRIVRTEMATAAHNAVIDGTVEDPGIIGYQWRLSASHRVPDICDYYAGIEMGLGRGVWTKEAVPRHKAHPHCLCLLIPRVSPVRRKGERNYPDFIKNAPPSVREAMLPAWAKAATAAGTPLEKLLRPDGLGLITKQAATDLVNHKTVENIVEKLAEKAKNAESLKDLWGNLGVYQQHVDKRIEKNHIRDEADYFAKVKSTLKKASHFNMVGGKYPSVEMVGGDWSVILGNNGLVNTAYRHEKHGESFIQRQTRLGHTVYEYNLDERLGGQLKQLFG